MKERGAGSIKVSKVKGHATEEQVESGEVKSEHREGNNKADHAANKGVQEHQTGLREFARWLAKRQRDYIEVMAEIQAMIVEVAKEQDSMRVERERERERRS